MEKVQQIFIYCLMIRPDLFTLLSATSLLLTEALQWGHKRGVRQVLSPLCSSVNRLALLLLSVGLQFPWEWLKLESLQVQNWTGPRCKLPYDLSLQADILGSLLETSQCFKRWGKIWVGRNTVLQVWNAFLFRNPWNARMVLPPAWTLAKLPLRVWIALREEFCFCTTFLVFEESHYSCDF